MQERKDKVESISRSIIRNAGKAIVLMHAEQMAKAAAYINALKRQVASLAKLDKGFEYYSLQAKQEFVEALAFYVFAREKRLISSKEADVGEVAYMLGMLDLVGELKRDAIDALRKNDKKYASLCYSTMQEIYDSTMPLRFANSLVPDMRKKQDTARIQLESLANELANSTEPHRQGAGV
ncbi:MAG: hypothetical protein ACP5T4_01980 [Candidatus Micrarchaeia archaeon]